MIFFKVISFDSPFTSSNKIKKQHVKKKPTKQQTNTALSKNRLRI